jgi:hypothetical protein
MARSERARWGLLLALGGVGMPLYLRALGEGDVTHATFGGLGLTLLGITAISVAGAFIVWYTRPSDSHRSQWVELGIILGVGVVLRAVLWPSPPLFSHDAYRYVWDAHLILHGVSPYVHPPDDPTIAALRDTQIWHWVGYPTAPTIYPPAAELFFTLIGWLAPLQMGAMKAGMAVCDGAVAILTILLLRQRGLDLRLVILYWWSPIPILEFALNAHVDVEAIAWTLAAVLVAGQSWRGARGVAGVLLALAALTKIYPLLFVIALARRSDRAFFVGLGGTLILAYLPFLLLGLGGGGFLSTYFQQRLVDQGVLQYWLGLAVTDLHGSPTVLLALQFLCIGVLCVVVAWGRWRTHWQPEVTILLLSAIWMVFAPHIFPWYVAMLLPFLAIVLGLQSARAALPSFPAILVFVTPEGAMALGLWLFALLIPFTYIIFADGGQPHLFQGFFYVAALVALWPWLRARGRAIRTHQGASSWNP